MDMECLMKETFGLSLKIVKTPAINVAQSVSEGNGLGRPKSAAFKC